MRYMVTAAAAALMSAGAAQAATVDLTYTVEAVVTDLRYVDPFADSENATPYPGPEIGEAQSFMFSVSLDTELDRQFFEGVGQFERYVGFDPATGAVNAYRMTSIDTFEEFDLLADGTGTGREYRTFPEATSETVFAELFYDVESWNVEGLPAPVPLPASSALLLAGVAGFAAFKRKQRSDPA